MIAVWRNVPVVEAVGYVGSGGHGGSRPVLLRTHSGEIVHVKLQLNPQSNRSLAGDWIGTLLGQALDAPFLAVRLVRIEHDQLGHLPFLVRSRWHPGLQFGTQFLKDAEPVRPSTVGTLHNLDKLPLVALMESWLFNLDLKYSHILAHHQRLVVTDHGFIFPYGPKWLPSDLHRFRRQFPAVKPLTVLAMAAPQRFDFTPALDAIMAVTRQDLIDLVDSVPPDWGLSSHRKDAIVSFLLFRQSRLVRVVEYLEPLWNQDKGQEARVIENIDLPDENTEPYENDSPEAVVAREDEGDGDQDRIHGA
ncbi:MAG: hypothetical protein OWR62_02880 [Sulfobacillus thermotolerans]|nr:hypothetical protein [Sulfobacillus thermotolerans]